MPLAKEEIKRELAACLMREREVRRTIVFGSFLTDTRFRPIFIILASLAAMLVGCSYNREKHFSAIVDDLTVTDAQALESLAEDLWHVNWWGNYMPESSATVEKTAEGKYSLALTEHFKGCLSSGVGAVDTYRRLVLKTAAGLALKTFRFGERRNLSELTVLIRVDVATRRGFFAPKTSMDMFRIRLKLQEIRKVDGWATVALFPEAEDDVLERQKVIERIMEIWTLDLDNSAQITIELR